MFQHFPHLMLFKVLERSDAFLSLPVGLLSAASCTWASLPLAL